MEVLRITRSAKIKLWEEILAKHKSKNIKPTNDNIVGEKKETVGDLDVISNTASTDKLINDKKDTRDHSKDVNNKFKIWKVSRLQRIHDKGWYKFSKDDSDTTNRKENTTNTTTLDEAISNYIKNIDDSVVIKEDIVNDSDEVNNIVQRRKVTVNLIQHKRNINIYDSFIEKMKYISKQDNILAVSNNLINKYESYLKRSNKRELQYLSNEFNNIYDKCVKKINNIDNMNINNNISINNNNNTFYNLIMRKSNIYNNNFFNNNNRTNNTDDVLNNVDNVDDDDSIYDTVIVFVKDTNIYNKKSLIDSNTLAVCNDSDNNNVMTNTCDDTNNVVNNCDDIIMNDYSSSSDSVNDDINDLKVTKVKKHRGGYDTYGWMYFVRYVFGVKIFVRKKGITVRGNLFKVVIILPPRLAYLGYDFGEDFIG
jgi:hypothetical protein